MMEKVTLNLLDYEKLSNKIKPTKPF